MDMGIFDFIIWTVGGFGSFGLCAVIRAFLENIIGEWLAWIIAAVLWFTMLILLTYVVNGGDLADVGPRFFGDVN